MTRYLRRGLAAALVGASLLLGGCVAYEAPPAYGYGYGPPGGYYPPGYYYAPPPPPVYYPAPSVSLGFGFGFGGHHHHWH